MTTSEKSRMKERKMQKRRIYKAAILWQLCKHMRFVTNQGHRQLYLHTKIAECPGIQVLAARGIQLTRIVENLVGN